MTTEVKNNKASDSARIVLPGTKFHRLRRSIQLFCVIVFILLPLFNVVRFDIPAKRFYFFGAELWVSEFAIIFFSLMFLMVLVAAMAMLYGRIYCGYLCPQMIFSEAACALEAGIARQIKRRFFNLGVGARGFLTKALVYIALLPAAVFFSFIFIAFFVPPAELFQSLLSLDIRTVGGICGAAVTLVTFLDFAFLRQTFCKAICPYGYLQGMLADRHTLLVRYRDPAGECIGCAKCVSICPMEIDIRGSNHQIECTHCGECIDSCSAIRGRLGKPTLIQYAWGDEGENVVAERSLHRRLGLRDGKRVAVFLLLAIYATALAVVIRMRQPVLVQIMPNRAVLYTIGADGLIHNKFRILASNRGKSEATLTLAVDGLPGARITGMVGSENTLALTPGETTQREFDVIAPVAVGVGQGVLPGVNRFRILTHMVPAQRDAALDETFIAPMDSATSAGKP
jgi:cytochrome c oxidase accessory protein FixG